MASFQMNEPRELIQALEKLGKDTEKMMGEMTRAGAEIA